MPLSINFHDVWFSYNPKFKLFSNLKLALPEDKTILLTGENGIGKTTFASLTAGLLKPLKGRIDHKVDGKTMLKKQNIYHELSYLRQNTTDNVVCANIRDELNLWLNFPNAHLKENMERIDNLLRDWELEHKTDTPVWELSSGELKSLALAGITYSKNKYWILDEPASSLDDNHLNVFMNKLNIKQHVNRGMLIVSHCIKNFEHIADKVLTLTSDGAIEE